MFLCIEFITVYYIVVKEMMNEKNVLSNGPFTCVQLKLCKMIMS